MLIGANFIKIYQNLVISKSGIQNKVVVAEEFGWLCKSDSFEHNWPNKLYQPYKKRLF